MKNYTVFEVGVVVFSLFLILNTEKSRGQPFLNSLAVLFRARPPWPTTYPTGPFPPSSNPFSGFKQQKTLPMPSALISSASTSHGKQGILIAHPSHMSDGKIRGPNSGKIQFVPQFHLQQKIKSNQPFFSHSISSGQLQNSQDQKSYFAPMSATTLSPNGNFRFPQPPSPPKFQSMTGSGQSQEIRQIAPGQTQFQNPQWEINENYEVTSGSNLNKVQRLHTSKVLAPPTSQKQTEKSKSLDFRPSPMLMDSGTRVYDNGGSSEKKSSSFSVSDAKDPPRYESGFKPISYHQYASHYGTTASHEVYTNSYSQWNHPQHEMSQITSTMATMPPKMATMPPTMATIKPREERKIITAEMSRSVVSAEASVEAIRQDREGSFSVENYQTSYTVTPSSSEVVEDWIKPIKNQPKSKEEGTNPLTEFRTEGKLFNKNRKSKFPVYTRNKNKNVRVRPSKCEKFHRYGFCPVTHHYPLSQVEKIASRCSALLSHLIAPLPRTEVHYDIVVTQNESTSGHVSPRQRMTTNKGWSWRNYRGRPVCDTEEVKITPGWAKNEEGEWLVILQTEVWKQEAQISVCSFAHEAESCPGMHCFKKSNNLGTKCVQRFTAQRLAVLDPENQERCPVIRSVFLPSACVCLSDIGSSSEESMVGSVVPVTSSEERSIGREDGRPGRRSRLANLEHVTPTSVENQVLPLPLFIENGTFTTTMVVTENISSGDVESTPSALSRNISTS